jgi:hypothetical protein
VLEEEIAKAGEAYLVCNSIPNICANPVKVFMGAAEMQRWRDRSWEVIARICKSRPSELHWQNEDCQRSSMTGDALRREAVQHDRNASIILSVQLPSYEDLECAAREVEQAKDKRALAVSISSASEARAILS